MKLKKIWYISKYALNPEQGGPSRQYLFSKYFNQLGYQTVLLSSNSNGFHHYKFDDFFLNYQRGSFKHVILKGNKIELGLNLNRIKSWFLFEKRALQFLSKQNIKKNDIIIVSSLSILSFVTGVYLKKKHKVKLIVEVRDIWPQTLIDFKNLSRYNPLILFLSTIEKFGYRYADYIVGTMGNLVEHIKNVSYENFGKIHYIPMGMDLQEVNDSEKEIEIPKHSNFTVGYAGTLGRANKVDLILEAAELLSENKKIVFRIMGDGVLKNNYLRKYDHLKNVFFLPKVKKEKVNSFLKQCDVLVNPWEDKSIYKFGVSPNKWIDYMYAAKPIIVPYCGYENIINEAKCGEFIETNNPQLFADTIEKYSNMSKEELKIKGQNGKNYLKENLSYEILSKKYIELFK